MSIPTISLNAEESVIAAHNNSLSPENSRLAVKELRRLRAQCDFEKNGERYRALPVRYKAAAEKKLVKVGDTLSVQDMAKGLCGEGRCGVVYGTCDTCQKFRAHLKHAEEVLEWLRNELGPVVDEVCPYSPSESTPNAAGGLVSSEPRPSQMVSEVLTRQKREIARVTELLRVEAERSDAAAFERDQLRLRAEAAEARVKDLEAAAAWVKLVDLDDLVHPEEPVMVSAELLVRLCSVLACVPREGK